MITSFLPLRLIFLLVSRNIKMEKAEKIDAAFSKAEVFYYSKILQLSSGIPEDSCKGVQIHTH